jgi:hypothetical protein
VGTAAEPVPGAFDRVPVDRGYLGIISGRKRPWQAPEITCDAKALEAEKSAGASEPAAGFEGLDFGRAARSLRPQPLDHGGSDWDADRCG